MHAVNIYNTQYRISYSKGINSSMLPEWTMQEKNEASSSEAQTSQVTVWTPEAEKTNPKYLQNHGIWTPNEDEDDGPFCSV
jgi:hypothetical protein